MPDTVVQLPVRLQSRNVYVTLTLVNIFFFILDVTQFQEETLSEIEVGFVTFGHYIATPENDTK